MPYFIEENPYGRRNPRRKHRNPSRNPMGKADTMMKSWAQGVGFKEMVGAGAGLIATALIPQKIVSTPAATTTQKLTKVAISAGVAIGAGMLAKAVAKDFAKPVVIGGFAGVVYTALNTFYPTLIKSPLGGGQRVRAISSGRVAGSSVVSPAPAREQETVSLITP